MKKYNIENTVHFVTVHTFNKIALFQEDKLCRIIIDNLIFYCNKFSYKLLGFVIMPNHVHLLIQLNDKYNDISRVMRDFKKFSSIQIVQQLLKDKKTDLLKKFSVTGKIFDYPATLGTVRSSDRACLPAESKDSAYPLTGKVRSLDRTRLSAKSEDSAYPRENKEKTRKYSIWMPDFYDFNIYSEKKLEQKLYYIHHNPVKAKLVKNPEDYPWSSYRNYEFNDHALIKIDEL
ncbi:MAG: transposase [Patescibacteria group bacterium]